MNDSLLDKDPYNFNTLEEFIGFYHPDWLKERGYKMKTLEEIEKKRDWLLKAINDEENQQENIQVKLYAQLDLINWILV